MHVFCHSPTMDTIQHKKTNYTIILWYLSNLKPVKCTNTMRDRLQTGGEAGLKCARNNKWVNRVKVCGSLWICSWRAVEQRYRERKQYAALCVTPDTLQRTLSFKMLHAISLFQNVTNLQSLTPSLPFLWNCTTHPLFNVSLYLVSSSFLGGFSTRLQHRNKLICFLFLIMKPEIISQIKPNLDFEFP